ncbi:MAG: InlB B-repeat-containing protein, partial [Oscillospiraceae bacterium]|nr:InlB B-repeat-containing protein [Oscillospiraceae bacterium]
TIISETVAPFNIAKNDKTYTIDVYAVPVDAEGNRLASLELTKLNTFSVTYNNGSVTAQSRFDTALGTYHSAYFGTAATVSVDNIDSIWCDRYYSYSRPYGYQYTLAYLQSDGTENDRWLTGANANASLYLRYVPEFTVTFASDGFASLTEAVPYGACPTQTAPGTWSRDGYKLLGWTVPGSEQTVYSFEELVKLPVTGNVTYTAKWVQNVTVSFNLGAYASALNPIEAMAIPYGSAISPLPVPTWKNNAVAMSFDGWYLNEELSQQVAPDYKFLENTILYAKWSPKDEGYYVYFMDFAREGQTPLVLVTYSVTAGRTASPYTPGNAPASTGWDGKWYLESSCANPYNFQIPVSDMTGYLTGVNGRDLYLYPGTHEICRAIFVTYGTKVDPVTVPVGGSIDLDRYKPTRTGFVFAGWALKDGTPVSGVVTIDETTTFYAQWDAGYVPFEAILRIENANDTGMTQADILGTWYAKAGSRIRVKSTYSGTGDDRTGTHEVVCVVDGEEYPVYKDAMLREQATLDDVYATYFIYNNTGTTWTDEVNWDDVYTGGEVPYSTRPVSSAGDTIINFDYMRVRNDIVFTITNSNTTGGYMDVYKLQQSGLITGSVIYDGTKPTAAGENVSAHGVSAENISWSYTATSSSSGNNTYTLHDMKYGQRIFEVYPVGASWLTARDAAYHQYAVEGGAMFASRRQDLTADFFKGSGRGVATRTLTAQFEDQEYIALMYAVECLQGETPDFTIGGVGYKVDTELCEVVKHTGGFSIKSLDGCSPGVNVAGTYSSTNKYYTANTIPTNQRNYALAISNAKIGNTSVYTLFNETYWPYYEKFNGVEDIKTFAKAYIFRYDRLHMNIQFNLGYDSDGNGANEVVKYEDVAYGESIGEYQLGKPNYEKHPLLNREGYEFAGWLDANGFVLEAEDWESMIATGDSENNTMIFIAKWEKISNNIVEYYEDRSSAKPFESHYFDDGELVQYPTMTIYPEGWVWQEYGTGPFQQFDWDVPMYGEYGVPELREINGEEQVVNVIRIYGTWDESHTRVVYDPNAPQGGIPGTAPTDPNEYTIWQSDVPVASRGETANTDPDMIFAGWQLDRNGIVYQPGDHVPVQWPRTMIFTAQWAKAEDIVHLRYDPNGGTPADIYPNEGGFAYKKNATAAVWDNTGTDGTAWFCRSGYTFSGWNTKPDGSGTAYAPDSAIVLTEPMTTLYAQWESAVYTLSVYKVDTEGRRALMGAKFGRYRQENGAYRLVEPLTTGVDGHITFFDLTTDTVYKLVEERPPDGYAIITKEIFFALRPNGNTVSLRFCDAEGNAVSPPNAVTGEYITGNRLLTLTVKNLRGYELPSTGGAGLFFYMLCGLFLVTAPLVYGLSLRRKRERRRG